jgi:hypothetical protein
MYEFKTHEFTSLDGDSEQVHCVHTFMLEAAPETHGV